MKNKQFIILAVVCVVTLLPFMGLTDFHTKGEPREAIVAYSMIETANWTRILILRQTQGSFSRPPYGLNYPV